MLLNIILGFAAVVAAKPIATDDYGNTLETRGGNVQVSETDLTNMKFYSQHSAAAYCNYNTDVGEPISDSGRFTGIGAYVAIDSIRQEIIFSIRGSNNIRNYITDVIFAWRSCDFAHQCKLHTGFAEAWDEIKDAASTAIKSAREKNPGYKVVITGHSLGGAVAIISTAYLRRDGIPIDLYTYGAPRVGNAKFANWFSSQQGRHWRVTHENDPVPRLPPIFTGYRHVTPEYWLSGGDAFQTVYDLSEIRVCKGIANIKCNASRFITDIFAHLYYLGYTGGCSASPLRLRDGQQEDPLPQDLKDRLTAWSQKDQEFVEENDI
ncbi:Lipase [Metarhizium anisopliae]